MPDIYTTRPDIVKQVLRDAGLVSPVQPTIIKERPAENTFRFDGKGYYAELYVHDLASAPGREPSGFPDPVSLAVGILIGAVAAWAAAVHLLRRVRP